MLGLAFSSGVLLAQPAGMVSVPGGEFHFQQFNRWREGVNTERLEMGPLSQLYVTEKTVTLRPFFIDKTEVTNAQYKQFLDAAGYRPKFPDNFLKHWSGSSYPEGQAGHPVVWVDLADAQAYCGWAGKRLPTEEQWQMAAQGTDGRLYPWGNAPDLSKANVMSNGSRPVGSYPQGASPYGCLDMVGNVWEWTDSKEDDGRHWLSYLRGGAWFQPRSSVWFTESGLLTNNQRLKFWWDAPGLNRASTIGFRCVQEAAPAAERATR
jgi:formylglycine-generating enzyme required for sulfatase activity